MADRVVIVDVRRGPVLVGGVEIAQMAGRAGRKHHSPAKEAFIDIVVPASDLATAEELVEQKDELVVVSHFCNPEMLAFHLISEVYYDRITTKTEATEWASRSFARFLGDTLPVDEALELLIEAGAICPIVKNDRIRATLIGSISATLYFNPMDICAWRNNFDTIFDREVGNEDVAVAWALSSVPGQTRHFYSSAARPAVYEYEEQATSLGLRVNEGTAGVGACWWWLMGGPSVRSLKPEAYRLRKDFGRILKALEGIGKIAHWEEDEYLKNLQVRIMTKVPAEVATLCRLNGITKAMAFELVEMGVQDVGDLPGMMSTIEGTGNKELISATRKICEEF